MSYPHRWTLFSLAKKKKKKSASHHRLTSVHQLQKGLERTNFIPVHIWWWDCGSGAAPGTAHMNSGVTVEKWLYCFSSVGPESPFPKYLVPPVSGMIAIWPRVFFQKNSTSGCFLLLRGSLEIVRDAEKWLNPIYMFLFFKHMSHLYILAINSSTVTAGLAAYNQPTPSTGDLMGLQST